MIGLQTSTTGGRGGVAVRYIVPFVAVGVAAGAKHLLDRYTGVQTSYLPCFGAVMLSSWFGGLGPGLVATFLAAILSQMDQHNGGPTLTIAFLVEGVLVSLLAMALHQARHRAAKSEATVEQAQGKLRDADDRQVAVNEVKEFAIFQIDPTGHISTWNQGAHRLFGFQDDEAIGQPTDILFTPEDRAQGEPARELNTARIEGRASDDRWQLRRDGTRFWASGVTTALHDEAGNPRGFTKVCRDLTTTMLASDERERLLKSEQQARHEAVMATKMKDQFLSVVSHELRTPLTAILLWVKILRAGTMGEKERAAALETIERSATAQGQLIEDLLDVSRIISGKLRLSVRPTELVTFVRAAIESVRPMADVKGVAVNAQIPEATGLVYADPDRIQQVIWNLLTNAVKFTDKGGRVDARLDRFDETLRITITDTGRGIEPEFLPHVFDPFQQAEHATRRREGGLGLGLAIARQLVQLHGGTIEATSAGLGKGSTFTVLLPLATVLSGDDRRQGAQISRTPEPFRPSNVLQGLRVLVVEDEPSSRAAIRWVLEQSGADVQAAGTIEEARQFAASEPRPQVILSDIGMPGEDGYDLIASVRSMEHQRGWEPVPAAALTAFAREEDRNRALTAGFHAHVTKPVEPNEVVATVATLAGRSVNGNGSGDGNGDGDGDGDGQGGGNGQG